MTKLFFSISFVLFAYFVYGQNMDIPSLFKPGLRLGGIYMPDIRVNDTVNYGMARIRATVIIPLNGNVSLDLKHLNISAHQSFLSLNAGLRETHFTPLIANNQVYNVALGVTHIRASLKNGFWIFHGRILYDLDLINQNNDVFSVLGGAAKIYVKGINKINIFGVGVAYSKIAIPFPIVGFRRKIADGLSITAILPLEVDLGYDLSPKFELEFRNAISALKTGFLVDMDNKYLPNYRNDNVLLSNYNYLATLLVIFKPHNNLQIYAEGGVYPYLQLNLTEDNKKIVKYTHYFAPYASVTIRYSVGKFLFGSQLFGTDE